MRADRLLSILLLLQANGRMSAAALARRLEVSQRTIYRDLEALGAAGVPVVTDMGPQGGASLLPGWRTDVTGLTEAEISALLAFARSGPAADLGLAESLDQAARKVAAAAGSARAANGRTAGAARFQDRILIDNDPWSGQRRVPPHLSRIQDAVWADRRLFLRYRRGDGQVVERTVSPFGLVAKSGVWYLMAEGETGLRTYRVSRVQDAEVRQEAFSRPPGFSLEEAWKASTEALVAGEVETLRVVIRADPIDAALFYRMGARYLREGPDGAVATFEFVSAAVAAAFLASFGAVVEVLEPAEVRAQLAAIGEGIAALYRGGLRAASSA